MEVNIKTFSGTTMEDALEDIKIADSCTSPTPAPDKLKPRNYPFGQWDEAPGFRRALADPLSSSDDETKTPSLLYFHIAFSSSNAFETFQSTSVD